MSRISDNTDGRTQQAIENAYQQAQRNGQARVHANDLALALIRMGGSATHLVSSLGGNVRTLTGLLEKITPREDPGDDSASIFSRSALKAISRARSIADECSQRFISEDMLFVACVDESYDVFDPCIEAGMNEVGGLRPIVVANHSGADDYSPPAAHGAQREGDESASTPILDRYSVDMTHIAAQGNSDPIIGRDSEMRQMIQVLSRRTKNNPIIIGEAGVGKALADTEMIPIVGDDGRFTYIPHGQLSVGDVVLCPDGSSAPVSGVYPQGLCRQWRLRTDDGRVVRCNAEHLWDVVDECGRRMVLRTQDIPHGVSQWSIRLAQPIEGVTCSTTLDGGRDARDRVCSMRPELWGSLQQRRDYLDRFDRHWADKTHVKNGVVYHHFVSFRDAQELALTCRSVGLWARVDEEGDSDSYRVTVESRTTTQIVSVTPDTCDVSMTCIMVDHPAHMYLGPELLPTHNTALVEGLAQRIVSGDVPRGLKNKRLVRLDMAAIMSGTSNRGDFEERLSGIIDDITASDGKIVTFIDEVHTLVGAGGSGASDAANIIKPALARGELRLVGATTRDEYQKYIEKDPALTRRFQQVVVHPPARDDALNIMRGIKERYETFHGVQVQDSALVSAVDLTTRYVPERNLPDKAIDALDEACSQLVLTMDLTPTDIDALQGDIRRLEVERAALDKESSIDHAQRIEEIDFQLRDATTALNEKAALWRDHKSQMQRMADIKKRLETARANEEACSRESRWDEAARYTYTIIPGLEKELLEASQNVSRSARESGFLSGEVDANSVARVVSSWTGIPTGSMLTTEHERVSHLEEQLSRRVVGQEEAVSTVARAIKRSKVGLSDPHRPLSSFLFAGSTGTGKTFLAQQVAQLMFDRPESLIRLDMGEYANESSINKLIGAPPGYIGYDDRGGQLTEPVRRNKTCVVLLDECERAHPEIMQNVLLPVLDEGRLTDSKGRVVDFRNTIIILTSNIGAENPDVDGIKQAVRDYFKPEFVNRLDAIVGFERLTMQAIAKIVVAECARVCDRIKNTYACELSITPGAYRWLTKESFAPEYGARPVRRAVQEYVTDALVDTVLSGCPVEGSTLVVDVNDHDSLTISVRE